ncbi:MAG: hypothetical protein MSG64_11190 [Pyrinomonadaceae bacterium MAG19_C2-C3]|nr:hypothetical protein [Pyrinomonadaceae bacterium MAG19_C2-C3]
MSSINLSTAIVNEWQINSKLTKTIFNAYRKSKNRIHFPAYTPEENPKEATWKRMKEEVSHHCWHETMANLRQAINDYYQTIKQHTVNFLEKFGYGWSDGKLYALVE